MVEQLLVNGNGSECGGCNVAQVTPSTEIRECANGKCEESMALVASMMASMESMASNGGFDGVEWWRRWLRWMASMVVTGVFDTEGTDVEVPLCPQW